MKAHKIRKTFLPAMLLFLALTAGSTSLYTAGSKGNTIKKNKTEAGMSGIVFFKTQKLNELKDFYINQVGCKLWMAQKDCIILKFGNMLFGFCQRDKADLDALITFFYEKKEAVDIAYKKFKSTAQSPPTMNPKYKIYHFFAKDPENRNIEFQYFASPIDWDFKRYK